MGYILNSDNQTSTEEFARALSGNNKLIGQKIVVETAKAAPESGVEFSSDGKSVFLYKSPKQGTALSVTISYIDEKNERKFLLVKPKSGEDHYEVLESDILPSRLSAEDTHAKSTILLIKEHIAKMANKADAAALDPIEIKDYLKSQGIEYSADQDYNSLDAVMRILRSELGYSGAISKDMIFEVYSSDNYTYDDQTIHKKVSNYLVDLGKLDKEPTFTITQESPVSGLVWANAKDIKEDQKGGIMFNNIAISHYNIPVLNNIIRFARDRDLSLLSGGMILSHENILAFLKHFRIDNDLKITSEFGPNPDLIFNIDKCLASDIGTTFVIAHKYLQTIYTDCKSEQNR